MKLKSLFLATLAAMAMVSCSNENDPIENGGEEKNAMFSFSIALPNSGTTRAVDPAGTSQEQNVNDITLVLTYEGEIPALTKTYPVSAFEKKDNIYTLIGKEPVSPGTATATVYVNSNGAPGNTVEAASTEEGAYAGLGNYASTVDKGNFFMSGKSAIFEIFPQQENEAPKVNVDRIAVKLDEQTDTDANASGKQVTFNVTAEASLVKKALTITLDKYAYSNLNKKSNALASADDSYYSEKDFYNFFVEDKEKTTVDSWSTTFKTINSIDKDVTYCFENKHKENNGTTPVLSAPTKIYYKANVSIEGVESGKDFFVDTNHDNELYTSFAALNAAYNNTLTPSFQLTEGSPNKDFMEKIGVKKYTTGVCYYAANIDTDGITRNNWYILKVTGITDLGLPEIDVPEPGKPTLLIFSVEVNPWTVKEVNIPL